jgi:hypothetical protein
VVQVIVTDEFSNWYRDLSTADSEAVSRYVDLLEIQGIALGHPYSSAINGATFALRELRVQSQGRPLRVFYGFDPNRAVVIIGGDKTGNDRFYEEYVPRATAIWNEYLREIQ